RVRRLIAPRRALPSSDDRAVGGDAPRDNLPGRSFSRHPAPTGRPPPPLLLCLSDARRCPQAAVARTVARHGSAVLRAAVVGRGRTTSRRDPDGGDRASSP